MNFRQSSLVAAAVGAIALGAAAPAAASVYAGARLLLSDLVIDIQPTAASEITGFKFNTSASAELTGFANASDPHECSTITTPCVAGPPVLSSLATLGAPVRTAGDFSFFGPGAGQTYSNSHSQIQQAELVTGVPTVAPQISEVEVAGNGAGSARTAVSSITTVTLDFEIAGGAATLDLSFMADPNLFVSVDTLNLLAALAQGSISATFSLTGSNGIQVSWTPNGSDSGSALEFDKCQGGVTCAETDDEEDLTNDISLPFGNPQSVAVSDNRAAGSPDLLFSDFGILLSGLTEGTYSLSLTTTSFATAEQTVAVPEPGILGLAGLGLAALGATSRRRSRKA